MLVIMFMEPSLAFKAPCESLLFHMCARGYGQSLGHTIFQNGHILHWNNLELYIATSPCGLQVYMCASAFYVIVHRPWNAEKEVKGTIHGKWKEAYNAIPLHGTGDTPVLSVITGLIHRTFQSVQFYVIVIDFNVCIMDTFDAVGLCYASILLIFTSEVKGLQGLLNKHWSVHIPKAQGLNVILVHP